VVYAIDTLLEIYNFINIKIYQFENFTCFPVFFFLILNFNYIKIIEIIEDKFNLLQQIIKFLNLAKKILSYNKKTL